MSKEISNLDQHPIRQVRTFIACPNTTLGMTAAIVWLVTQFLVVQAPYAAQQTTVYSLADGQVNLKPLEPMSPSIKAILAMYVLQAGGGCDFLYRDNVLKCELTSSLGLEEQCSEQHINLVRSWFKKSLPPMGLYPKQAIQRVLQSGEMESICYNAPSGARVQVVWENIRVKVENDLVFVDADSYSCAWCADGPIQEFRYSTVYRVNRDDITVVKHKKLVLPPKPD